MSYEHREGQGALFKNGKKETEKHPDYKGNVMVGGVVYELAGWKKEGGKGTFLSLKAQLPREQGVKQTAKPAAQEERDDLPF